MDRLKYYILKALEIARKRGTWPLFRILGKFLISRRLGISFVVEALDSAFWSRWRRPEGTVLKMWGEFPTQPAKLCLYCTFSLDGRVHPYVFLQLQMLRAAGFSIIVVSSSPVLSDAQAQGVLKASDLVIHRRNIGWDFGSWKTAWAIVEKSLPKQLGGFLLMNDSCWGPYFDPNPMFRALEKEADSVVGMTFSQQITPHLQSYFLHFGSELWNQKVPHQYMQRVRVLATKWAVVRYYEIGGSRWLKEQGVQLKAWVDPSSEPASGILKKMVNGNPTEGVCAAELVDKGLMPFFKRSNLTSVYFPQKHALLSKEWILK